MSATTEKQKQQLAQIARDFYSRGWSLATSSNLSVRSSSGSILITPSGLDKSALTPADLLEIDINGAPTMTTGDNSIRPSAEATIHCMLYRWNAAMGAVLHTHSIYATVMSIVAAESQCIVLAGYEMLKALRGITSHLHRERVPVFPNSQDLQALSETLHTYLTDNPETSGFLLQAHGLYTWGLDVVEAQRHTEALEFMLECEYRQLVIK